MFTFQLDNLLIRCISQEEYQQGIKKKLLIYRILQNPINDKMLSRMNATSILLLSTIVNLVGQGQTHSPQAQLQYFL